MVIDFYGTAWSRTAESVSAFERAAVLPVPLSGCFSSPMTDRHFYISTCDNKLLSAGVRGDEGAEA